MAKKTSNKTLLLIIIFIFLLILSAGGYAAYKFGYLTRLMDRINPTTVTKTDPTPSGNPNQPDSNVIITPQATESAQEESSSSGVLNKQTLKIQVLNGSDVAGQAAKAKEALINLGYTDIETGNSPESTASSHIEFSENVSSVNRILIIDDFKKIVSNLEELTSNSTESDVVLTLGQDYQ